MPRAKVPTERANLYLTSEAVELLAQLAPSANKRGQYISDLIVRAARERGILAPSTNIDLAVLQEQLRAANYMVQNLQERVAAALGQDVRA